jgi:hypothetical protein
VEVKNALACYSKQKFIECVEEEVSGAARMHWQRKLRLLSGYQGTDKPPRKNMPTGRYRGDTVDYIP